VGSKDRYEKGYAETKKRRGLSCLTITNFDVDDDERKKTPQMWEKRGIGFEGRKVGVAI